MFSCEKDDIKTEEEIKEVILTDSTAASIMFVNLIEGETDRLSARVNTKTTSAILRDNYSNYTLTETGTQEIIVSNGSDNVIITREVNLEAGKYYSVFVSGGVSSPSITVLEDDLTLPVSITDFNAYGLNLTDNVSSISYQVFFPSYNLWATTGGWFEEMGKAEYSPLAKYTGGIALDMRIIEGVSEEQRDALVLDGLTYHAGSTDVLDTLEEELIFNAGTVNSLIFYGSEGNYKFLTINRYEALK